MLQNDLINQRTLSIKIILLVLDYEASK